MAFVGFFLLPFLLYCCRNLQVKWVKHFEELRLDRNRDQGIVPSSGNVLYLDNSFSYYMSSCIYSSLIIITAFFKTL